jgi:hypothetical protein
MKLLEEKLGKTYRGKRVEQSKITSSIMFWEPQAITAQLLTKVAIVDASASACQMQIQIFNPLQLK